MNIALVGSGPSLLEAKRGAEIDSHDAVMRLFDCAWQNLEDHGIKWTYGLIPGPWRGINFRDKVGRALWRPERGWFAYVFDKAPPALPHGTTILDVRAWNRQLRDLSRQKGVRITRGFAMFVAAATLKPARLTGFGFDALAIGRLEGYAYHPGYLDGPFDEAAARERHDLAAERRLIDQLATQTGIEIVFR